ncbi:MAG TPA: CDGSH iron-sulfur domain-containing protein [Bacteroidota bacterium]|nr:CDGSH iron-sulfur domain-containing protein [Bacteroidota bacterium]
MPPVKITVRTNGSLRIEGDFEIYDMDGGKYDLAGRTAVALCRCGLSKDKPFCDSSHKNGAFISEVRAKTLPPPAAK